MDWQISLSRRASKFLANHHLQDDYVLGSVRKAVRKLSGENVAVNIKRLTGAWEGFYRIRIRKVRIIFSIDTQARTIFVDVIDFRGSAYR